MIYQQKVPIRILLVEDDREFAFHFRLRLSKQPEVFRCEVFCVGTCQHGLKSLSERNYDLILLDLSLPDSQGIATFSAFESFCKMMPVVIMTGSDDNDMAVQAVRRGAEDYVVKGEIDFKMMNRIIHQAVERHRIRKELEKVSEELRATNLHLQKMTILDPLTELYNRRGLQQALSREIQWVQRHKRNLLAMIIDIDHFKQINDNLGYPVGDVLLREIAGALQNLLRITDHVARIGGDEFIVLLPETAFKKGVKIAERIRLAISDKAFLLNAKQKVVITASIGLIVVPAHIKSIDELLAMVHPFLKQSKLRGRNQVTYEDLNNAHGLGKTGTLTRQLAILRQAREFWAIKQPIVRLDDRSIVAYEMLSRLKTETFYMPDDFFRIANENNMLTLVDRYCFSACMEASITVPNHIRRHVNLLPSTILDVPVDDFIETLPPNVEKGNYCFEISEQQIIGDPGYLMEAVDAFKAAGISIAMDDVGFGHSCLESLIAFEPDIIKLDQRYIQNVSRDPKRLRLLQRVHQIANDLNAMTIAEGIEHPDDLKAVQDIGILYGQGYLLGRPA